MARRRPSDTTSDGPQIAVTEPSPQPDESPWISRPAVRVQRLRPSSAYSPQPALRSFRHPSPHSEADPFIDSPEGSNTRSTLRRSLSPFRRRLERTSHDDNLSATGDERLSAASTQDGPEQSPEYTDDIVDWLDVLGKQRVYLHLAALSSPASSRLGKRKTRFGVLGALSQRVDVVDAH